MYTKNIILFSIFATSTFAELVTTHDSRFGVRPVVSAYQSVDIKHNIPLRQFKAPALVDTKFNVGVTITGTVAQAESDLAKLRKATHPAQDRLRGIDRAELIKDIKAEADRAQGVRALAIQMERLADLVAAMIEQQSQER